MTSSIEPQSFAGTISSSLFTVRQAAEYLNYSVWTVYSMIKGGKLPVFRLSPHGHYRIHISALNNVLNSALSNKSNHSFSHQPRNSIPQDGQICQGENTVEPVEEI